MLYAEVDALKEALEISGSDLDDQLEQCIAAASRALDKLASVRPGTFAPSVATVTRTYTAVSPDLVVIDDLASLDDVASGGVAVSVTAEPLNAEADGEPYRWLESDGAFSTDRAAVSVTGTWGWPATPPQVTQWVLVAAARLLKRLREAPFGLVTGSFDGEVVRLYRDDPDTELLVGTLRRHRPVIV